MPGLTHPPFARGVVLLCKHDSKGTIGLLVNQLSDLCLGDVLTQTGLPCRIPSIIERPVLIGGPLQQERGFVLHLEHGHWNTSYRINDTWSVTTSRDILKALAIGQGPHHKMLVVLGYAGWAAGQLEQELCDNSWLTVKSSEQIVFDTLLENRWNAAIGLIGIDPLQIPDYTGHV